MRPAHVVTLALTLSVAVAAAVVGATTSATPAVPPPQPVAVTGEVPERTSLRTIEAWAIQDDARVRRGATLSRTRVPVRFTQNGRRYLLWIDPAAVPAPAVDAGGVVDWELRLSSSTRTWTTFVSSRLVRNRAAARTEWVDPLTSLPGSSSAARPSDRARPAIASVPDLDGTKPPHTTLAHLGAPLPSSSGPARVGATGAACDYQYVKDSNRSTTIATSYPYGASTSWLDVERTEGGTYGMAFDVGGGFKAQGSRFAGGGWGATWPRSNALRSYRIWVNYHLYRGGCGGSYWAPHIETGGTGTNRSGVTRPSWNTYCTPQRLGVHWRRYKTSGRAYSFGQAVKFRNVIGIDLSATKNYSNSHTLHYLIRGNKPKKLCGNNDYPSYASKIVERLG